MASALYISALLAVVESLHTRGPASLERADGRINGAYTFDKFVRDFDRSYEAGSKEYTHRASVFQDSLAQIHAINSRAGRSWTAGVYPFMDWTGVERAERLHGYEASGVRRTAEVALQTNEEAAIHVRVYGGLDDSFETDAPEVRDQGVLCGSCWAHTAVEAVEAQLMKSTSPWPRRQMGEPPQLSVQALVDCVSNPEHCGGSGGCGGATPELAFKLMRDVGLPTEAALPYEPRNSTGACPISPYPSDWVRVTLAGWRVLPRNQAQPLMRALVEDGPVAVAADARNWPPYHEGIYDGCRRDAIPNHSVLARGFGAKHGKKYWLLQNSWGATWGESGSIRIFRHDDEDSWCGVDRAPQAGVACESEAHTNVTVCGTCGLLYDAVIPQLDHIVIGDYVYSSSGVSTVSSIRAAAAAADARMPMLSGSQIDEFAAAAEATAQLPSTTSSTTVTPLTTTTEAPHVEALMARQSKLSHVREVSERNIYSYDSNNLASDFIRSVSEAQPALTTDFTAHDAAPKMQPADREVDPDALPEATEVRRLEMQSLTRDLSRRSRLHQEFGSSSEDLTLIGSKHRRSSDDANDRAYGNSAFTAASEVAPPEAEALPSVEDLEADGDRQQPQGEWPSKPIKSPADVDSSLSTDALTSDAADASSLLLTWPSSDVGEPSSNVGVGSSSSPTSTPAAFHPQSMALSSSPMSSYIRR